MATALVPTYRFEFSYVVNGLAHKVRHYVNVDTSTPVKVMERDGSTAIAQSDAADGFAITFLSGYGLSHVPAMSWIFQHLVAGVWLPINSGSHTNTNSSGVAPEEATQVTLVFRDLAFKQIKVIMLESLIDGPFHVSNLAAANSFNAALGSICQQYDSTFSVPFAPHLWVVGRSGNYLALTPLIGATWDLNDKVRRARNLT